MTTQEIRDRNRLIAEFMGLEESPEFKEIDKERAEKGLPVGDPMYIIEPGCLSNLHYNTSWNWLMPVWIKIQNWYIHEYGLLTSRFEFTSLGIIINSKASNSFRWASSFFHEVDNERAKKEMWIAVSRFIEWYNKNIKQ